MKHFSILLAIIFLTANSIFAQTSKAEKKELYPNKYTFEKADDFQKNGEYEKAIWFYINLFPENKIQVTEQIMHLAVKLDTIHLYKFIQTTFTKYATFDPEITSYKNGVMDMDPDKLLMKGRWGDELIQYIYNADGPMYSAEEYNSRGLNKYKNYKDKESILDYDKAIKLDSNFSAAYFNRALAKKELGEVESACEDWKKALELGLIEAAEMIKKYCK
jgi:tetratricopeptide (TPR) repeat protein